MTAREYLAEIDRKRARIDNLRKEINDLRESISLLPGVNYEGEKVQTSGADGHALRAVEALVDKERRLVALIEEYEADRIARIETIHKLTDRAQIEILYARYVTGLYWWEIVKEQGLTERRVYQIHEEGIREVQRLLDEEEL